MIVGATGSGKTSGSGTAIAEAALKAGYGGAGAAGQGRPRILEDALSSYRSVARPDSVRSSEPWRFNFIDYEMRRAGSGAGLTENIVSLFSTVLELSSETRVKAGAGRTKAIGEKLPPAVPESGRFADARHRTHQRPRSLSTRHLGADFAAADALGRLETAFALLSLPGRG